MQSIGWCRAFNVAVVAFSSVISSPAVGLVLLPSLMLILKRTITFCKAYPRWLGSNLPQCLLMEAWLLGNYRQSIIIFPCPRSIDPKTWNLLTILMLLYILAHGPWPNTLTWHIYPYNNPLKHHLFSPLMKVGLWFLLQNFTHLGNISTW